MKRLLLSPLNLILGMWRVLSPFWVFWVFVLFLVHFLAPLFFLEHLTARAMLTAALLGFVTLCVQREVSGMTRLMGLAHLPWVVPIALIYAELASGGEWNTTYQAWLWTGAGVGTLCLVIDAVDVVRYLRGEREPL